MRHLLDTNILLRLVDRQTPEHVAVRDAAGRLIASGHWPVAAPQNLAEFWGVCTRPANARGGLGLSSQEARQRMDAIEQTVSLLPDSPDAYDRWRQYVYALDVRGVQVHDARLAALMSVHGVTRIVTLNVGDFGRYPGLSAASPEMIISPEYMLGENGHE